jgi:hypothetical protein
LRKTRIGDLRARKIWFPARVDKLAKSALLKSAGRKTDAGSIPAPGICVALLRSGKPEIGGTPQSLAESVRN